jgi:hypothetical protein
MGLHRLSTIYNKSLPGGRQGTKNRPEPDKQGSTRLSNKELRSPSVSRNLDSNQEGKILMNLVLDIHGLIRWAVLAAALGGLLHLVFNTSRFAQGAPRLHRILSGIFMGLMDLQLVLGAVILIGMPVSRGPGLPHALLMLAAVALGHVLRVRSRKASPAAQPRMAAVFLVGPLALILAGLALLP